MCFQLRFATSDIVEWYSGTANRSDQCASKSPTLAPQQPHQAFFPSVESTWPLPENQAGNSVPIWAAFHKDWRNWRHWPPQAMTQWHSSLKPRKHLKSKIHVGLAGSFSQHEEQQALHSKLGLDAGSAFGVQLKGVNFLLDSQSYTKREDLRKSLRDSDSLVSSIFEKSEALTLLHLS